VKLKLHSLTGDRWLIRLVIGSMLITFAIFALGLLEEQEAKQHDYNAEGYRDKYIATNQEGWRLWRENNPSAENKLIEAAGYERLESQERIESIKASYAAMYFKVSTQLAMFSVMALLASLALRERARNIGCFIGIVFACVAMIFPAVGLIST
jgi:hypothetical protein